MKIGLTPIKKCMMCDHKEVLLKSIGPKWKHSKYKCRLTDISIVNTNSINKECPLMDYRDYMKIIRERIADVKKSI